MIPSRILPVLAILVMVIPSEARETGRHSGPTDSSQAIQFGIGNYLGLNAFDSKGIAFKQHLSTLSALRCGVTISGSNFDTDIERQTYLNDTLVSESVTTGFNTYSLTIDATVEYLKYFDTESAFFPFVGFGPEGRFSNSQYTDGSRSKSTTLGAAGAVGTEWFATDRIGLHAEYRVSAGHRWTHSSSSGLDYSDDPPEATLTRETRSRGWFFSSGTVLFGLSVYF